MQAFLRAAHRERDDHEVLMTWVKQVRDVAYDAEDILQNFSIHLKKPSWWRLRTLRERRRIAKQMKELRARGTFATSSSRVPAPSLKLPLSCPALQLQRYSASMKRGVLRSMTNQKQILLT